MLGGKYTRIVDCFTPHYYVLEFDIPHYVFIPHTGYWEAVSNQPQPRPASGGSGRVRTYCTAGSRDVRDSAIISTPSTSIYFRFRGCRTQSEKLPLFANSA